MSTTGYSGTPLLKKLGIKPEMKLLLVNAPGDYSALVAADITPQLCHKNELPDFIHLFATSYSVFEKEMKKLKAVCRNNPAVIIWVSWYKKASKMETDLTEDSIRNYALQHDLVDVKVCAVNELWSGLKLVVPLAKRK